MTFASYITSARIVLIIPILFCISQGSSLAIISAFFLFIIASLTDYLDGYVARKTNSVTKVGALLDLVADKLLTCLVLVWLLTINNLLVFAIPTMIIIFREITISYTRQFISENKNDIDIQVTKFGKGKTTIQFISISSLILIPIMGNLYFILSCFLLWIAALFSIFSLINYLFIWKEKI